MVARRVGVPRDLRLGDVMGHGREARGRRRHRPPSSVPCSATTMVARPATTVSAPPLSPRSSPRIARTRNREPRRTLFCATEAVQASSAFSAPPPRTRAPAPCARRPREFDRAHRLAHNQRRHRHGGDEPLVRGELGAVFHRRTDSAAAAGGDREPLAQENEAGFECAEVHVLVHALGPCAGSRAESREGCPWDGRHYTQLGRCAGRIGLPGTASR